MQPFSFFFVIRCGAGAVGVISGRVRALNLTVPLGSGRVGSGQTISGTGRVRASVLSPCRPLVGSHESDQSTRKTEGSLTPKALANWSCVSDHASVVSQR